jgi:plasmid segregation protein ParM
MSSIGLDIGHSAVKVSAGGKQLMFPSAATPAVGLSVEESARSAAAETVRVKGTDYFVGNTALIHTAGKLLEGLSDDWIETPEHIALMIAGYRLGKAQLDTTEEPMVVLGLPSRLHKAQHQRLREIAVMHLGLPEERVRVIPQPVGAYMGMALDTNGTPAGHVDIAAQKWGVIDIGFYTSDFGLLYGGVWSDAGARSIPGANAVAANLRDRVNAKNGTDISLRTADEVLRSRTLRLFGKSIDVAQDVDQTCATFARQLVEGAITTFGNELATLDGILVAGGGADLVFPLLKNAFDHAVCIETPRFSVAEGLRRYGLLLQHKANA